MKHTLLSLKALVATVAASVFVNAQQQNASSSNPLITRNPPEQVDVSLNLTSGPYDNYLFRSNLTAAQVLLTNTTAANPTDNSTKPTLNRFLVALPAGNSGSVAYFLPYTNGSNATDAQTSTASQGLTVTLGDAGIKGAYGPNNQSGVTGELLFSQPATLGTTLLGSIRTVRDFTEGNGLTHEIFNWTVTQADNKTIWLTKPWLNETIVRNAQGQETGRVRYALEWLLQANNGTSFDVVPSNNGTYTPPTVHILPPPVQTNDTARAMSQPGSVTFTVQVNETALAPLSVDTLFTPNTTAAMQPEAQSQFSFMTYASKFTAGGWRFLTYFGRDTMFTTRMLMNNKTVTPFAAESVLGGVIERINITSGEVCHEETIGDYATFVNIGEGQPEKGNEPFYDYKMKDTHYVLLPQLADYLLRYNATNANFTASPEARLFLSRRAVLANGTSYIQLLQSNIEYVLNSSVAFAQDPSDYKNLARIEVGVPVGNWRDSNEGLGWGVYPYDVSTALVPAALYAVSDLARSGLLSNYTSSALNASGADLADKAASYAKIWEDEAPKFFQYNVTSQQAQQRLEGYVQRANLSTALLYGDGSLNSSLSVSNSSSTGSASAPNATSTGMARRGGSMDLGHNAEFPLAARQGSTDNSTQDQAGNTTVYGLSLLEDGAVVPVLHSDLSFNLLYSRNPSRSLIEAVISALQPYPRGLLTNVGMLVANPAYDPNTTKTTELDRTAYHGTVSWGFQTNFMASGLDRIIASCDPSANRTQVSRSGLIARPDWCDDQQLVSGLTNAQAMLWQAVNGAFEERFAEVWSWTWSNETERFEVTPLGEISPEGTESDAVQLWSYGLLGIQDPTATNETST
ncbi:glycogen debranching enzyme [Pseudozyma hubeiensis SY62]|uniref:Glycogen debranching enzyme n=1 Tax=Pseudozyma hubeiensis (strain SY62) TaxID=1305764 RepID=R9P8X4_PSEHS|nr:glycogen debranching enzyme [Pseudozyma hubeiensis SY62]GAC97806.1 glycogen debranching enzyme [Pseudozyma hubeiensis SY62]